MESRCISPLDAHARQQAGALLIDVRAAHERALGIADGARGIVREDLLEDPAAHLPDRDAEILLLCQAGMRSAQCLPALAALSARYRVVALSNGNADVHRVGIGRHFHAAVSAAEVGVGKPDPRIFRAAAQAAGADPAKLLYLPLTSSTTKDWVALLDADLRRVGWAPVDGF